MLILVCISVLQRCSDDVGRARHPRRFLSSIWSRGNMPHPDIFKVVYREGTQQCSFHLRCGALTLTGLIFRRAFLCLPIECVRSIFSRMKWTVHIPTVLSIIAIILIVEIVRTLFFFFVGLSYNIRPSLEREYLPLPLVGPILTIWLV